jgi:hypothetical protein
MRKEDRQERREEATEEERTEKEEDQRPKGIKVHAENADPDALRAARGHHGSSLQEAARDPKPPWAHLPGYELPFYGTCPSYLRRNNPLMSGLPHIIPTHHMFSFFSHMVSLGAGANLPTGKKLNPV